MGSPEKGRDVYAEPRGLRAGYHWPQYSLHRGKLQMLLYRTVLERLGPQAISTGMKVTGYRNPAEASMPRRSRLTTRSCARRFRH
jgi:hypothetical protein